MNTTHQIRFALYPFLVALTVATIFLGSRATARQLGGGSCPTMSATWPDGPLCRAPCTNFMATDRHVDCILLDVVSVANPEINFQVFADEVADGFNVGLPAWIEPGEYVLTARLLPYGNCPIVEMGPMVFDVE